MSGFNLLNGTGQSNTNSIIKRIQRVTVNLVSTSLSGSANIEPVDLSRTFLIVYTRTVATNTLQGSVRAILNSNTQISLNRVVGGTTVNVEIDIVELSSGRVQQIQSVVPFSVGSQNITIENVDTTKSLIFASETSAATSPGNVGQYYSYGFVNENTVRLNVVSVNVNRDFNIFIVDFS